MRIDRIDLFQVAMPLIYPWRTAYGEDAAIEAVLCRSSSGSLSAWGGSARSPPRVTVPNGPAAFFALS